MMNSSLRIDAFIASAWREISHKSQHADTEHHQPWLYAAHASMNGLVHLGVELIENGMHHVIWYPYLRITMLLSMPHWYINIYTILYPQHFRIDSLFMNQEHHNIHNTIMFIYLQCDTEIRLSRRKRFPFRLGESFAIVFVSSSFDCLWTIFS